MTAPSPQAQRLPFGVTLPAPTILDRAIGYLSPAAGLRRLQARTLLHLSGAYVGARSDRRSLQGWNSRAGSPDGDTSGDLVALRSRSRDLYRNAPLATGIIKTTTTSVVGWGLDPQPRIDRTYLKLTEAEAATWQRQMKRLWWAFATSPAADFSNRLTFYRMQDLVYRSRQLSGDVLVARRWKEPNRARGEMFGTRIQVIEADRVCNPHNGLDTDRLVSGIEFDGSGTPLAYWITDRHPGEFGGRPIGPWARVPAYGPESQQRQVLHYYDPDGRPGVSRGVPALAPVIEVLRQLTTYADAELTATIVSTLFTAFIKTNGEEGSGLAGTPGLVTSQTSERPDQRNQVKLAPGGIAELAPGEEIGSINPMRPNSGFGEFFRAFCQQIAVACNLPHELVVKSFTASYSASMAALQEAWRTFRTERSGFEGEICQPIYEWIVTEAVLRGYLAAPGFFTDPLARNAWCTATWTGPTKGHLNPLQEANAAKARMESTVTTLEQEVAEYSGRDWEEVIDQRGLERRRLTAAGLTIETVAERIIAEKPALVPAGGDLEEAEED